MLRGQDVLQGLGGHLQHPPELPPGLVFGGVCVDSRQVQPGDLFFALKGARADGHDFVSEALRRGALGAVVQRPLPHLPARAHGMPPLFWVNDTLAALQALARYWRAQHSVVAIGITGSVGKTTTKEFIGQLLAPHYPTLVSQRSFNTEIGLPLALLALDPHHRYAVLELGMHTLGDIQGLCALAQPTLGVITNIGPTHLERLGTIERIAQAKAELLRSLPAQGVAILNGDDPLVRPLAHQTPARLLFYGCQDPAEVAATALYSYGLQGLSFTLSLGGEHHKLRTPLIGRHLVYGLLAAAAVGWALGMPPTTIAQGLEGIRAQPRIAIRNGLCKATILDDSYNASPASTISALELLGEMPGRRVAVLGDMLELGSYEEEGHRLVGRKAAQVADLLVTVGERGGIIGDEARRTGLKEVHGATAKEEAEVLLKDLLRAGDYVLVKASRALGLETLVEALRP